MLREPANIKVKRKPHTQENSSQRECVTCLKCECKEPCRCVTPKKSDFVTYIQIITTKLVPTSSENNKEVIINLLHPLDNWTRIIVNTSTSHRHHPLPYIKNKKNIRIITNLILNSVCDKYPCSFLCM